MNRPAAPIFLSNISARRICIIKPSALGDVVQSLPLLPALRGRFPRAHIAWVINRSLAPLLDGQPGLNEIIPFERRGSLRHWGALCNRLRLSRFDLVLDLQGLLRTGIMMIATGAPLRIGLESAREGSRFGRHFAVPGTGLDVAPMTRYQRLADALDAGPLSPQLPLCIPKSDRDWAATQLRKLDGAGLAIHAGAGWITKRWPPERFAAVACKAIRQFGLTPILLGTTQELPLSKQVEQTIRGFVSSPAPLNLAGQTSLKQLAALLDCVPLLLTNDSGPMQLAALLGTPVVGVFTCTSPAISGPPGKRHELVATGVRCHASYRKRCPYSGRKHLACMEELDVERVWSALCRAMQKNGLHSNAA